MIITQHYVPAATSVDPYQDAIQDGVLDLDGELVGGTLGIPAHARTIAHTTVVEYVHPEAVADAVGIFDPADD